MCGAAYESQTEKLLTILLSSYRPTFLTEINAKPSLRPEAPIHPENSLPMSDITPKVDATDELELSDEDILDAMAHIPGYIDISTEDFRAIYHLAWRHAVERLRARKDNENEGGRAA